MIEYLLFQEYVEYFEKTHGRSATNAELNMLFSLWSCDPKSSGTVTYQHGGIILIFRNDVAS